MSGRRSRRKGARTERGIVNALKTSGIAEVRVPLSGAVGGRFARRCRPAAGGSRSLRRGQGPSRRVSRVYSWLNERDVLIVKADRQEPLVIVRLSLAADIAKQVA